MVFGIRMSAFSLSVFFLLSSLSTAWAQGFVAHASDYAPPDNEPPEITHQPVAHAPRESDLIVKAVITDATGVFAPTVSYRNAGSNDRWSVVEMKPVEGEADTFAGAIAGSQIQGDIEYFIEAYDTNGNGPARVGSAESPLKVIATDKLPREMLVVENGLSVGPVAVAGAGVLMTAVGAALWFTAANRVEDIDAKYSTPGQGRLPADAEATQAAIARSRVGSGLMMAGGAAIAGGVVWFLLPTAEGANVGVSGSF